MLQWPGNHTAFVFSDPAGANACIGFAKLGKELNERSSILFCNKKYNDDTVENLHVVNTVPEFNKLGIDCVFTGTSHPESSGYFEIDCIKAASKQGIRTISFIDHWVNFKLRFLDGNGQTFFPDEIWVVDEKAKELALKEGLPENKLVIHPNPYHEYLRLLWKPVYTNKHYLDTLSIPKTGRHVLFAPDPLSIRDEKKLAGFTEDEALSDICEVINDLGNEVHLVVKCHPLQPVETLKKVIKDRKGVYLVKNADPLELINASDLIVGFYSNLLLEAEAMEKQVTRYFPGNENADLLNHNNSLEKAVTPKELSIKLKHHLHG